MRETVPRLCNVPGPGGRPCSKIDYLLVCYASVLRDEDVEKTRRHPAVQGRRRANCSTQRPPGRVEHDGLLKNPISDSARRRATLTLADACGNGCGCLVGAS